MIEEFAKQLKMQAEKKLRQKGIRASVRVEKYREKLRVVFETENADIGQSFILKGGATLKISGREFVIGAVPEDVAMVTDIEKIIDEKLLGSAFDTALEKEINL